MNWASIVILIMMGVRLLLSAHTHGKDRGPENFWVTCINVGIFGVLLYFAGVFK